MQFYKINNRISRNLHLLWGLLLISSILIFTTCNQSFDPLQENDKYHFSMYGYLDANIDTQWVRISPVRQNINESPDPTGIQVTLEHLESGKTVTMNDSLFSSKDFLNYWTTMDIENEETYRITAESDGKSSRATVTTPKKMSLPIILEDKTFYPYGYLIYIDGAVEHIADVQSVWYVILNPNTDPERKIYTFNLRKTIEYSGIYGGSHVAYTTKAEEQNYIENQNINREVEYMHQQIFVAAAGPDWDDNISSVDDIEYFLDGTASNVENGLGYIVGIDSRRIPLRTCYNGDRGNIDPCYEEEPYWYE